MATATKAAAASMNGHTNGKANRKSATTAAAPAQKSGPTADQFRAGADLLKTIADGTRLKIAYVLLAGEKNVTELCQLIGQSQPAVSHHISIQRLSGIIVGRRSGKNNVYSLTDKGRLLIAPIAAMLDA